MSKSRYEDPRPGDYIAVDLDRTLAIHTDETKVDPLFIGEPIPEMVRRVKRWISMGIEVRIFTARADGGGRHPDGDLRFRDRTVVTRAIEQWCVKHIGRSLKVTNEKTYGMIELWDDKAVQVEPNTGKRLVGEDRTIPNGLQQFVYWCARWSYRLTRSWRAGRNAAYHQDPMLPGEERENPDAWKNKRT